MAYRKEFLLAFWEVEGFLGGRGDGLHIDLIHASLLPACRFLDFVFNFHLLSNFLHANPTFNIHYFTLVGIQFFVFQGRLFVLYWV